MIDPNETIDAYARYRELQFEANKINKDILFNALVSAGITSVTAEFDGQGDSGQIEDISAFCGDAAVVLPDSSITLQQASYDTGKLDSTDSSLREAIETLCYGFLSQKQAGWENDDGAYGEFTFHVPERKIDLAFDMRFTDSTLFCHSF